MNRYLVRRGGFFAAFVLATVGCAPRNGPTVTATGSMDVLRADEIARSGAIDAYQAIKLLRPAFFQTRGRTSILRTEESEPSLYVDERPFGSLASLRDIPAREVIEVRYYNASQAQMKWGAGNSAGAIHVRTGVARTPNG